MSEHHLRTLVKTGTWRISALIITYVFVHAHAWAIGGALIINLVKTILYYAHERLWNQFSWQRADTETALRSFVKTISWKITTTIVTAAILYLYMHDFLAALVTSLGINATKLIFYYAHERLWQHISWRTHQA